jgi:hypothetical protein
MPDALKTTGHAAKARQADHNNRNLPSKTVSIVVE